MSVSQGKTFTKTRSIPNWISQHPGRTSSYEPHEAHSDCTCSLSSRRRSRSASPRSVRTLDLSGPTLVGTTDSNYTNLRNADFNILSATSPPLFRTLGSQNTSTRGIYSAPGVCAHLPNIDGTNSHPLMRGASSSHAGRLDGGDNDSVDGISACQQSIADKGSTHRTSLRLKRKSYGRKMKRVFYLFCCGPSATERYERAKGEEKKMSVVLEVPASTRLQFGERKRRGIEGGLGNGDVDADIGIGGSRRDGLAALEG
jgi:hypothetical protein